MCRNLLAAVLAANVSVCLAWDCRRSVAQISNLLYRSASSLPTPKESHRPPEPPHTRRLEIGDTADWKSALRAGYAMRPNFFSNSRKFISISVGRP